MTTTYYAEHRGHDCEIGHLTLSKQQRQEIASKLAVGISYDEVIDSVHVTASQSGLSHLQFVTKKDLRNISRDFGIDRRETMHQNDADSVAAWVERTKKDSATENLVRFVKFQGEKCSRGILRKDDFMLIVASDAQLIGARQLCRPMKELCLDSTHGLNSYDFQMTTLMTIDEHGEGFPIAFCYSSRVDVQAMSVYLQVLKPLIGDVLENVVLMTDDSEVYSNAWNDVIGKPAARLLCTWHIDRAWRKNLPKIKGSTELKATIYKTIRSLMEIPSQEMFHGKLNQFMSAAKEDSKTAAFACYFESEYATRPELWAYSYRMGLKVHHNMHLEAMHRVIKHVQLRGLKVRRMDKSIHALMQFLRTKMSDRLLKLHKGKWTRHIGGIRMRHKTSQTMNKVHMECLEVNKVYMVHGSCNQIYTVRQADLVPHTKGACPLMCSYCGICVHMFSCTCIDSALRNTICKHIHLAISRYKPLIDCASELSDQQNNDTTSPVSDPEPDVAFNGSVIAVDDCDVAEAEVESINQLPRINESDAIINHLSTSRGMNNPDMEKYMSSFTSACSYLQSVMSTNVEVAKVIVEQLTKLKCLVSVLLDNPETPRLPDLPATTEPANKKAPTQRVFHSTKKARRRKQELTVSKPTEREKEFLLKSLTGSIAVISTQAPGDHDYNSSTLSQTIDFEHSY